VCHAGGVRGVDLAWKRIGSQGSGWTVPLESPPLSIWFDQLLVEVTLTERVWSLVLAGMGCVLASLKSCESGFCAPGDSCNNSMKRAETPVTWIARLPTQGAGRPTKRSTLARDDWSSPVGRSNVTGAKSQHSPR